MIIKRDNRKIYGLGGPFKRIFEHYSDKLFAIVFDTTDLENEPAIIIYLCNDEICGAIISENWICPVLDELIAGKYYLDLIENKLFDKTGNIIKKFEHNFELHILPKSFGKINIELKL